MSIKQQIDGDLKKALLSGDKTLATILRGLKSAILYVEVAQNKRESGLDDATILEVLGKEAKKRQESADLYAQANDQVRQQAELNEKAIIDEYLPEQMSDEELTAIVDAVVEQEGPVTNQTMGKIIGQIRQQTTGKADGGRIAQAVKQRME
jgi:uncharacterized protein